MQYSIIVRTRVSSLPLARVTIQRPEGHGSTCCDFTTPQLMAKKRVRVIFPGFEEKPEDYYSLSVLSSTPSI